MATSDKNLCTLCHDDGASNEAVRWCTECEVFLCKDCEKHHSKSSMFKNHKTMSTNEYISLPAFVQKISSQCRDHKKKFELYCSFHACPCCVQCITDTHKKCQDMKPLLDILKQVKSSAPVQLLKKDLQDLQENFEEIIKYLKSRINTNTIQNTKAIEEIRSMRKSINDYLNTLETDIVDDLESKHQQLESKLNILLKEMEQQANQIGQLQDQFSKMTKYGTELQIYVGLREIEKTTSKAAKYIDDLEKRGQFSEKNLEVSISPAVQSVLQDVKLFGNVHIRTAPSTLKLKAGRKDQAQELVPTIPEIDQIKPTFLRSLVIPQNMKEIEINASAILPDGRFLILDFFRKRLLLFSNEGIFIREVMNLTGFQQDVCYVRNNEVAVTLGSTQQTVLVNIEKNKIVNRIQFPHYCQGVASDGQIMVISSEQNSTTVNLDDMSQTILEGVSATSISLFKGHIYSNSRGNKVSCHSSNGELIWTFNHLDIDYPHGIALDMYGFVYLACYVCRSIVVVSPDGKTSKTVLSLPDRNRLPWAIDINRETGIMVVVEEIKTEKYIESHWTASVYKI